MNDLFIKNLAIYSPEESAFLKEKKVLVAGCGGLGGSVIELLARSGIGRLVLLDGDSFEPSNMNRQILCTTETLGKRKAEAAKLRVLSINPEIEVQAECIEITKENAAGLLKGCDIVIDALDSVPARLMLEDACAAFEVSEAIKYLLGRPDTLAGQLLLFDLLNKESQILPLID